MGDQNIHRGKKILISRKILKTKKCNKRKGFPPHTPLMENEGGLNFEFG